MDQIKRAKMKGTIFGYITKHGGATFAELSKRIEGFEGDRSISADGLEKKNIFLWFSISTEAIKAMTQLLKENRIAIVTSEFAHWFYLMDGVYPLYRIAKSRRHYKKPRWLPSTINIKRENNGNCHQST